jgi:hypothetical protein
MKISYPEKYNSLINEYGEEEGLIIYKKFLRQFTLEKCILKYGEEEGRKIYKKKKNNIKNSGVTLEKCILKYGEEEGRKKYENWKKTISGSKERYIKKYGEVDGLIRYNSFRKKCAISDDIRNNPNSTYNKRKITLSLEYYLEKTNGDLDKAKQLYSERQDTGSLQSKIKKYGKELGIIKYNEIICLRK